MHFSDHDSSEDTIHTDNSLLDGVYTNERVFQMNGNTYMMLYRDFSLGLCVEDVERRTKMNIVDYVKSLLTASLCALKQDVPPDFHYIVYTNITCEGATARFVFSNGVVYYHNNAVYKVSVIKDGDSKGRKVELCGINEYELPFQTAEYRAKHSRKVRVAYNKLCVGPSEPKDDASVDGPKVQKEESCSDGLPLSEDSLKADDIRKTCTKWFEFYEAFSDFFKIKKDEKDSSNILKVLYAKEIYAYEIICEYISGVLHDMKSDLSVPTCPVTPLYDVSGGHPEKLAGMRISYMGSVSEECPWVNIQIAIEMDSQARVARCDCKGRTASNFLEYFFNAHHDCRISIDAKNRVLDIFF